MLQGRSEAGINVTVIELAIEGQENLVYTHAYIHMSFIPYKEQKTFFFLFWHYHR